jgi:hypothetical protein
MAAFLAILSRLNWKMNGNSVRFCDELRTAASLSPVRAVSKLDWTVWLR